MADEIERIWESTFTGLPAGAADEVLAGLARLREEKPRTTRQTRALSRWHRAWLSEVRERLYAAVPTKLWQAWSGCRRQQLDEQSRSYGLPLGDKTIDLPALVRALHRFFAEHWPTIRAAKDEVGRPAEPDSPQLERWRRARADMAELDLEQRRGDLVDPREFNRLLLRFTQILRGCGETLQRQYGADAQSLLDEGIDEIEREIDRCFATGDEVSAPPVGGVADIKGD